LNSSETTWIYCHWCYQTSATLREATAFFKRGVTFITWLAVHSYIVRSKCLALWRVSSQAEAMLAYCASLGGKITEKICVIKDPWPEWVFLRARTNAEVSVISDHKVTRKLTPCLETHCILSFIYTGL
jgi:hypothetical protein